MQALTCDPKVTILPTVESVTNRSHDVAPEGEAVFKALADPTRRAILDGLFERPGQSLGEIEGAFEMSRFGVMKHLRILEAAGLVTTHKVGRTKLHYLNAVPIRELQERWIHKFAAGASAALLRLKADVEKGTAMEATTAAAAEKAQAPRPSHVYAVFIRTTPERLWEAITSSEYTLKYYFASTVESEWRAGTPFVYRIEDEPAIVGEVIESTPPTKLVCTFDARWDDEVRADPPSRITWLIEEAGPGVCKLTVIHDGFDSETATYGQVREGMPFILSGLKTLLETGEPLMQG
jgi:DNA-binding transcriptional ArsR family regulator/uncharacterized protein YndB with AHSA1/START domain